MPKGHGQLSWFVVAESEDQAISCVEEAMKHHDPYDYDGWGTDYYCLTISAPNICVTNNND
jgi:hypothetical protein